MALQIIKLLILLLVFLTKTKNKSESVCPAIDYVVQQNNLKA